MNEGGSKTNYPQHLNMPLKVPGQQDISMNLLRTKHRNRLHFKDYTQPLG
jgi:hypothetical protein